MKRTSILAALILSASISADAASPKISHDTPTRGAGLVDVIVQFKHTPAMLRRSQLAAAY
jgi:hypothetical protein